MTISFQNNFKFNLKIWPEEEGCFGTVGASMFVALKAAILAAMTFFLLRILGIMEL